MTAATDTTSKNYAQSLLPRLKEVLPLMESTGLDHVDIRIHNNGKIDFWLRKKMSDGNFLAYDYTYDGNSIVDGERVIVDPEGSEVA